MLAVMLALLAVIPCEPGETSTVCYCKAGMLSACETLRLYDPRKAAEILEQLERLSAQAKVGEKAAELEAEARASSDASEPPECKGQKHHIISKRIAKALEEHLTLRGHYKLRDPRFVTRAVDEQAHCGYQDWHRKVDEEVVAWLERYREATAEQFEAFLREIYSRPDMLKRFPHGF